MEGVSRSRMNFATSSLIVLGRVALRLLVSPWVAPGIEKRANAFAAAFLMPKNLVRRLLPTAGPINREHVVLAAERLHVSETALVEHIYNLDLISEWDRERLRAAFRG